MLLRVQNGTNELFLLLFLGLLFSSLYFFQNKVRKKSKSEIDKNQLTVYVRVLIQTGVQ